MNRLPQLYITKYNYVDLGSGQDYIRREYSRSIPGGRVGGGGHYYVHKPRRLSQGLLSTFYTTVVYNSNLKQFPSVSPDKTLGQ